MLEPPRSPTPLRMPTWRGRQHHPARRNHRPDSTAPHDTTAQLSATAEVTTGDARGPVEFLDAAAARIRLVSMGGAMGGTSLLVAILVVVGTFALSVQQRHRELALLRAVAATSGQIRGLLGREALIVGTVAGVAGALLGLPLGAWLYDRFVALGAVPATLQHTTGVVPPLAALAATVFGAWAAARVASRRISRISPAQALAEAGGESGAGAEPGAAALPGVGVGTDPGGGAEADPDPNLDSDPEPNLDSDPASKPQPNPESEPTSKPPGPRTPAPHAPKHPPSTPKSSTPARHAPTPLKAAPHAPAPPASSPASSSSHSASPSSPCSARSAPNPPQLP
jgi:hypothetical protein